MKRCSRCHVNRAVSTFPQEGICLQCKARLLQMAQDERRSRNIMEHVGRIAKDREGKASGVQLAGVRGEEGEQAPASSIVSRPPAPEPEDCDCYRCEDERRRSLAAHPAGRALGLRPKDEDIYERIAEMGEEYAAVWRRYA